MNNFSGKYEDGTFFLTLQILKSFLLGQKAYVERVSRQFVQLCSAREVIAAFNNIASIVAICFTLIVGSQTK